MSDNSAQIVYEFLSPSDETQLEAADVIIGFGHFDQRIARQCGALWRRNLAPRIIFTGGIGAGSADLGEPEAEAFAQTLLAEFPEFPLTDLLIEPDSTNTGDNVRFTLDRLTEAGWSIRSAILVATPFRQRRVNQTWAKVAAPFSHQSAPPTSDLATDTALFATKGEDLIDQFRGEIHRLRTYPTKRWISPIDIPDHVTAAVQSLT